jgi:hypothetical protein
MMANGGYGCYKAQCTYEYDPVHVVQVVSELKPQEVVTWSHTELAPTAQKESK